MKENPRADHYLVPWILQALHRHASDRTLHILDVGCGDGYVAAKLAAIGHAVTGFDICESDIAYAREHHAGVEFSVHSIGEDRLAECIGLMECVIAIEVLEHLYDPKAFFQFCRSVLTPDGLLLVTTPYHGFFKNLALSLTNGWDQHFTVGWDGGHIKFFSQRTLETMMTDAHFKPLGFDGIGRVPYLWKSMGLTARK